MRLNVTIEDPDRRVAYALDVAFDLDGCGAIVLNPTRTLCRIVYDEFDGCEMLSVATGSQPARLGRKVCEKYADEIREQIAKEIEDRRENAKIERAEARAGL